MMRWRLVVPAFVAVCAGCPSIDALSAGDGPPPTIIDPPIGDDDDDTSSSGNVARCNPRAPFGTPTLVDALDGDSKVKDCIAVTKNEREIFYLRNDGQGEEGQPTMRHGERDSNDGVWRVETAGHPSPTAIDLSSIASGGTKLYYYVNIEGINFLHAAPRNGNDFGAGIRLSGTAAGPNNGFVVDGDDAVYYPLNGDIWRATINRDNNAFELDTKVLTNGIQRPIVTAAQTTMYFARNEGGVPSIWSSRRANTQAGWAPPTQELADSEHGTVLWVSADDCVLYTWGPGEKIFESRRGPPTTTGGEK